MIRKGDVQWWVLEARKYPEAAPIAIEFLSERLGELDRENEELRNEVIRLRQRAPVETSSAEVQGLRQQVEKERGGFPVYQPDLFGKNTG